MSPPECLSPHVDGLRKRESRARHSRRVKGRRTRSVGPRSPLGLRAVTTLPCIIAPRAADAKPDIILVMAPIYTGKGDDGFTGLLGRGRVPKHDPRVEACGAVDEASAALGLARALAASQATKDVLLQVQHDLYRLMAEIAAAGEEEATGGGLEASRVEWLEQEIGKFSGLVSLPRGFVMAGDSVGEATLDLGRTIVRRAERLAARLSHEGFLGNPQLLRYLNRLSSLCFCLSLWENEQAGVAKASLAKPDKP